MSIYDGGGGCCGKRRGVWTWQRVQEVRRGRSGGGRGQGRRVCGTGVTLPEDKKGGEGENGEGEGDVNEGEGE